MHIILFSLKCFHLLSGCMDKAVQEIINYAISLTEEVLFQMLATT